MPKCLPAFVPHPRLSAGFTQQSSSQTAARVSEKSQALDRSPIFGSRFVPSAFVSIALGKNPSSGRWFVHLSVSGGGGGFSGGGGSFGGGGAGGSW